MDEEQVYANVKPGKISNELRKALGLHKNDLPPYIYKMRKLGYPPGWIEEAYVEHSELNMYDIEGKDVKNKNQVKTGIDPEKVIDYPGFNAPMEKGMFDVSSIEYCPTVEIYLYVDFDWICQSSPSVTSDTHHWC